MKAVMSSVPPEILAWRKRTGADRWDEVWEGVLHMVPSPDSEHQDLEGSLETYLRMRWSPRAGGKVYHQINVARSWPDDYRIPDLVLLRPERFSINLRTHFDGGPDAVVEIRSPDDETYEKIPFYAAVGVSEVWVIHRDTKAPEVRILDGQGYRLLEPRADGWVASPLTGVELRAGNGKLLVRMAGDDSTREELPADF